MLSKTFMWLNYSISSWGKQEELGCYDRNSSRKFSDGKEDQY